MKNIKPDDSAIEMRSGDDRKKRSHGSINMHDESASPNKVSIIATVLNEHESIRLFLDDLLTQTRRPDEIVIVDAGSTDGTIEQVRSIADANPIVKLLVEEGCNVARGRNFAIRRATSAYIAITDAGSRVDRRWLEELMIPFGMDHSVDVVGGRTEIEAKSSFEQWLGFLNRPFEKIDFENYLPTARSLGLKKSCWEAVGGFPEELTMWSEDTVFLQRLKSHNCKVAFTPNAIVYWRPRRNLREFWNQYYEYGKGDGEAKIFSRLYLKRAGLVLSIIFFFIGFSINLIVSVVCAVILTLAFIRLVLPLKTPTLPVWKLVPLFLLVLVMEIAQVCGYPLGRFKKKPADR